MQSAYDAVSGCFNQPLEFPLEIEILPKDYDFAGSLPLSPGIWFEERSLGIRKDALGKAFLDARLIFFGPQSTSLERCISDAEHYNASHILSLFDSEHLTAANLRKKHLLATKSGLDCTSDDDFRQLLRHELTINQSLLNSPLNRHTKSPVLWYHRRWLLQTFEPEICLMTHATSSSEAQGHSSRQDICLAEMSVVMRAGDLHPNNYYAFTYARWLTDFISNIENPALGDANIDALVDSCLDTLFDWCLKHPSDISGWSFLLSLFSRCTSKDRCATIVGKLLDITIGFRWHYGSVWIFIRTALFSTGALAEPDRIASVQKLRQQQSILDVSHREVDASKVERGPRASFSKALRSATLYLEHQQGETKNSQATNHG